jgi:hypothetical protein
MKTLLFAVVIALATVVPPARAAAGPAEVVQAFNQALTARKLTDATALLASGSVQFTLRSAHAGVATGSSLTGDLKTHWNQIGPVLFSVTSAYKRAPRVLDTRIDGDLATVWVQVASETVERNGKSRKDSFSEVYLLVKTAEGWRIGAVADNRGTDNLSVGGPPGK